MRLSGLCRISRSPRRQKWLDIREALKLSRDRQGAVPIGVAAEENGVKD